MKNKILITISHYNIRNKDNLIKLINSLKNELSDLLIVINDDDCIKEKNTFFYNTRALIRPNTGMNIGAWNASFLKNRDYDFYLFLQDECQILDNIFIKKYIDELSKKDVGMTGESVNYKWANSWSNIAHSTLNYKVGYNVNKTPIFRVQFYLNLMKKWNIDPGISGIHLRALVWGFTKEVLNLVSPFPLGIKKEECIAAEIAVSKKVESLGFKVTQISEQPFKYISHFEWKLDGTSKK